MQGVPDLLLLLVILAFPACQALLEAPISQMKQVNRYLYRRNYFSQLKI